MSLWQERAGVAASWSQPIRAQYLDQLECTTLGQSLLLELCGLTRQVSFYPWREHWYSPRVSVLTAGQILSDIIITMPHCWGLLFYPHILNPNKNSTFFNYNIHTCPLMHLRQNPYLLEYEIHQKTKWSENSISFTNFSFWFLAKSFPSSHTRKRREELLSRFLGLKGGKWRFRTKWALWQFATH